MNKYEIINTIGNGSFGIVYKSKEISTGNIVALKVVNKSRYNPKELKNFHKERRIHSYVEHPNIIQMIDSFETVSDIVVVTALAEIDLKRFLRASKRLAEDHVQKLTWDLISALYYLHSHRIVHRDLKPENILLDANGLNAKLCDFGLARNMTLETHLLTSMIGTPLYMAPELINGSPYDFRADFWSTGCIIYQTLTGEPPFRAQALTQLIELLKKAKIDWSLKITADCRSFLQGLLMHNPTDRFEWKSVVNHPFVKDHLVIIEDNKNELPLTNALTDSQNLLKEKQRQEILSNKRKNELSKAKKKSCPQYITTDNDSTSSMDSVHAIITTDVENIETDGDTRSVKPSTSKTPKDARQTGSTDYYGNVMENPNLVVKRFSDNFNLANASTSFNQSRQTAVSPSAMDEVTAALKNSNLAVGTMAENLQNDAADYKLSKDNNLEKLQRHIAVQQFQQRNRDILARIENQSMQLQRKDLEKRKLSQNLDNFSVRLGNSGAGNELEGSVGKEEPMSKSAELTNSKKDKTLMPQMETEWNACDNYQSLPIENEEWLAFLRASMQEILDGEIESLKQHNLVGIIVAILRNFNANSKVIEGVAQLLSLPLVLDIADIDLTEIKNVYIQSKLLPNVIFASKLIYTVKANQSLSSTVSSSNARSVNIFKGASEFRKTSELTNDELKALCSLYELACHLVHLNEQFLSQFCDTVNIIASDLLIHILSDVGDNPKAIQLINIILAILCLALREFPENAKIIENIIFNENVSLVKLLKYNNSLLKSRLCMLLRIIGRFSCSALQNVWCKEMKDSLEALSSDSNENVQQKARETINEFTYFSFYEVN